MAKNKIEIDVKVDDKGTTKKVALESKKAAKALDETGKSARTADRNLKGAAQASANGTKNFSKMAQGMGGLVAVYATAAAQIFAITAAFNALEKAANFRVVTESQIAFASSTGIGLRSLTSNIKEATGGLLGFEAASQAAAIGAASGLSVTQIEDLAEGAKNVSLILGRDVTDSFNRLIRGVTKAEPELLDELGITLRLADATEKYAGSLGKTAKQLSLYERSQAVALEVQTQLDEKYATTANSVELQANSITKLGVEFEKVLNPLKEFTAFIAEPTAEFLGNNIKALTVAFALLAVPIVKALIPGLEDWATTAQNSATQAATAIKEAKAEIEALKQAQVELNQAGVSPESAAQKALSGINAKKGTGIDLIQKGQFEKLTKRQISALRVAAEKGTGAVTKMSKTMARQYIAALREMEGKSSTTSQKLKTDFDRTKTSIVLNIKTIGAQWNLTMAKMKQVGAATSKYLNKVMRFAGILGVVVLIKDVLVGIAQALGLGTQAKDVLELAEELESVSDKLKDVQKEYSKFAEIQTKFYDKSKNLLPTFEQLGAIGDYIGGNSRALKEALDLQNRYNDMLEQTAAQTENIQNLRKEVANAQLPGEARRARTKLRTALNEGDRSDEFDVSRGEGFFNQVDPSKKLAEAQEEVKATALAMAAGLRAARIETQVGGNRFLELIDILAQTGTLTPKNQKEFEALSESLVGTGAAAKLAKQEYTDLTRLFTQKVTSITQFSTSVTNQIERTEDLIRELAKTKTAEAEEYTEELNEQLIVLNKIRDLEIQKKLDDERIARDTARFAVRSLGGTNIATPSGMMEERKLAANYASASAAEAEARRRLEIAMAPPEGTAVDAKQVELLTMEVEKLEAASKLAFAQFDDGSRILSTLAQSFETSMTSAIEGLITGTKTLKEAFADMAKSILSAIAQLITKMLVFRLLSSFLPGLFPAASAGASAATSSASLAPTFRMGGIAEPPAYASGGIARGSTAGYPAVLHGTEAVVPLPNNRSIPVDLKGAGQQNNVTVNVSVDSNGNAQQNSQSNGQQGENLGNAIAVAVQKELQNQKRSGGILSPYGAA